MSIFKEIIKGSGFQKTTFSRICIALLCGLVFGSGGLLVFTSEFLKPFLESRKSQHYIQIEATVLKSELIKNDGSLRINLRYEFNYQGETYRGSRFELNDTGRNFITDTFRDTVKNYPRGSLIPIWVNPENPKQSVYKREMVITNWIALPFSIPFLTIGICSLGYILFNSICFKAQQSALQDDAKIARSYSATEIHAALIDEDFGEDKQSKLTYLKHDSIYKNAGDLFALLFTCGIISVFIIINVALYRSGSSIAIFLTLFLIPFLFTCLYIIKKFISSLFGSKGEDYVILSQWDEAYSNVTHHWLLLTKHSDSRKLGLFTTAHKNQVRALKKILKKNPAITEFETPDRNAIKGSITHTTDGSKSKFLKLIIFTKNHTSDLSNKHEIIIYSPPSD